MCHKMLPLMLADSNMKILTPEIWSVPRLHQTILVSDRYAQGWAPILYCWLLDHWISVEHGNITFQLNMWHGSNTQNICVTWQQHIPVKHVWHGGRDSSVVRALDSWLKGRGFKSVLERQENVLLQGRLSVLTNFGIHSTPVLPQ